MTVDNGRRSTPIDVTTFKEITRGVPLIGETITLREGCSLQRPSPEILHALAAVDKRIRYFPIDINLATSEPILANHVLFDNLVRGPLARRIIADFPDYDPKALETRGTMVSLRDEVPFYTDFGGDKEFQAENALTILQKGRDGRNENAVPSSREINNEKLHYQVIEYMLYNPNRTIINLLSRGKHEHIDNFFPAVIVYKPGTKADWRNIPTNERIAAIYIIDRIVDIEILQELQRRHASVTQTT